MDYILSILRSEVSKGATRSDVISQMKRHGLSIIDAIKATRVLYGISLGEAKQAVASHAAYIDIAAASAPLHNEILDSFQNGPGAVD